VTLNRDYFRRLYEVAHGRNLVGKDQPYPRFSRRTFLSGSAAIAIARTPVIRGLGSQVEMRRYGDRISLLVDGTERWVVAPAFFAGSPSVDVVIAKKDHYVVDLIGARYPGTVLSADTRLEIVRTMTGWDLTLRFLGGLAQIRTGFLDWLDGICGAVDFVGPGLVSNLVGGSGVRLVTPSVVSLAPDWTLWFGKRARVSLSGLGLKLAGRGLRVSLRPANAEGALGLLETPSVGLQIVRGSLPWGLPSDELLKHPDFWIDGNPFDLVTVELSENREKPLSAAVFRSQSGSGRLCVKVADGLRDSAGNLLKAGLRDPIYAVTASATERESLLLANLERDLEVHGDGFTVTLQNPPDQPAVQIVGKNGTITKKSAIGVVTEITTAELQGAIATFKVTHGARMPLFWDTVPYVIPDAGSAVVSGVKDFFCFFGLCERARLCLDQVVVSILRPQDFLALDFRFKNLSLSTVNGRPFLVRSQETDTPLEKDSGKPKTCTLDATQTYLMVDFPGQSIAEQAFLEVKPKAGESCGDVSSETPQQPVQTILSGPSRLVFAIPDALLADKGMPFTLENLLDWKRLVPILPDNAQPPVELSKEEQSDKCPSSKPGAPTALAADVTQIEFPYRLLIAPHCASRWLHEDALPKVKERSRAELWHTSLGISKTAKDKPERIDINDQRLRTIRAVWARDYKVGMNEKEKPCGPPPSATAFRMAMNKFDRSQIVRLSSDYTIQTLDEQGKAVRYTPGAVAMKHMALSSLGAWFDGVGQWEIPHEPVGNETFNVEGWTHRASQSRDHFVKVVYSSFLAPFCHRVAVIKETQRFFYCGDEPVDSSDPKRNVCYLRQKFYIVVREPVKIYPAAGQPYEGRHLPFRKVEIRTLITPALDDPCDAKGGGQISGLGIQAFWPFVHGEPFFFEVAGYDWAEPSQVCVFRIPMVCVDNILAFDRASLRTIEADYRSHGDRRQAQCAGQGVHFASSQKSGDTRLQTDSMSFDFEIPPDQPETCPGDWCGFDDNIVRYNRQPFFYPTLDQAVVDIPAVQHVSQDTSKSSVSYPDYYLRHGFSPASDKNGTHNPGEVFLERVQDSTTSLLKFQGSKGGGFVVPNIAITGLSRQLGAVAGKADQVAQNVFNPADFFEDLKKKIQGIDDALNPKLLGVVPLGEVIAPLRDIRADLRKVPQLLLEELHDVSEWLRNTLNNDVFKRFQDLLSALQASLNSVQQQIASAMTTAMGGAPDVKLQGIATAIQAKIDAAIAPIWKDFSLPEAQASLVSTNTSIRALLDVREDILDTLTKLQQQRKAITQRDRDDIDKTFTVYADRQLKAFQNKLGVLNGVIASLHSKLPTAALAKAVETMVADVAKIGNPAEWVGLITTLPNDLKSVLTEAGRLRASLQSTAASLNGAVGPETLKKLLSESVSDARDLVTGEIGALRDSLQPLLAEVAAEIDRYKVSPIYTPYKEAVDAFTKAKSDIVALQQDLTNLAQAAIDQAQKDIDQQIAAVFDAAFDAAFNAIPPQVWTALFAFSDFEAQLSTVIEQIARPVEITVRYDLAPALQDAPADSPIFLAHGAQKAPATFAICVLLRKRLDPVDPNKTLQTAPAPEFHLNATLTNFSIQLLPSVKFFILQFASAAITVKGSEHPEVTVKLDPSEPMIFGEALKFIEGFVKAVQNFGGDKKNGPFIRIYPWGVRAGYSFTAPDTTAGGFNVHGLSLGASVELSFENKPLRVRFHFAERAHPFILSAGIYGGGGYFLIDLGPDGVELLEISLEFGAYAAVDVALASGEVHILGGIYYSSDGHDCRLSGFVDAGGCLSVIGLIDVNLDFYLGLSYTSNGRVEGECTVTVEIGYAFFSISVHLTAHRTFASGGSRLNAAAKAQGFVKGSAPALSDAASCKPLCHLKNEQNWKKSYYTKFAEVSH